MNITLQEKSRRKTFLLLIEHNATISQLKNINFKWVESILNHYLYYEKYNSLKDMPFYIEDYKEICTRIFNKDFFGSLVNIYSEYITFLENINLKYPLMYIPLQTSYTFSIIKYDKKKKYPLLNNFHNILNTFNADSISLLLINGEYYIFDYTFKDKLIDYSLKYEYIENFSKANNLKCLDIFIVLQPLDYKINGLVIEKSTIDDITGFYNIKFLKEK